MDDAGAFYQVELERKMSAQKLKNARTHTHTPPN
jgi:hypothetical protein